jgi:hypothetical protein
MSYDFHLEADPGGPESGRLEPYFDDTHPALSGDGMAGNVIVTANGYARCGNYTSNVSGMWADCLTAALDVVPEARQWIGDDDRDMRARYQSQRHRPIATDRLRLRDLVGKRGEDIAPVLAAAVEWGIEHFDELREQDPPNGWGNAEGAITYLWDIQRMCEAHPHARLAIWS